MAESKPYSLPNTEGRYVTVSVTDQSGEVYRINDDGTRTIYADYFVENGNTVLEASTFSSQEFQRNLAQNSQGYNRTIGDSILDANNQTNSQPDPNQPGAPGGSTPANPNTPQEQESNKPKVQRLTYPSTISDSQDRIKFTAVEYIASGVTQEANTGSGNLPGTSGIFGANRRKVRSGTSVFLAIQSSITDNNSVDWQGGNLNEIERRLANVSLQAMTAGNEDVTKVATEFAKNVAKDVGTYAPEIRVALAGEAVGIQNILGRFGTVLNPNLELLFTGPQLRPFNFNFKLSPRNEPEAREVKDIINFFKKNMAPIKEKSNIFLRAPKTFFIEYQYSTTDKDGNPKIDQHPGLNLIKECALTNCSVDYTPLGTYMTYPDGTMASYTLNLQFQELEPIYSDDYADELNGTIEY